MGMLVYIFCMSNVIIVRVSLIWIFFIISISSRVFCMLLLFSNLMLAARIWCNILDILYIGEFIEFRVEIKLHKENKPIRPVVNSMNSPNCYYLNKPLYCISISNLLKISILFSIKLKYNNLIRNNGNRLLLKAFVKLTVHGVTVSW